MCAHVYTQHFVGMCYVMLCYYYSMKEVTPSAEAGINGEPVWIRVHTFVYGWCVGTMCMCCLCIYKCMCCCVLCCVVVCCVVSCVFCVVCCVGCVLCVVYKYYTNTKLTCLR